MSTTWTTAKTGPGGGRRRSQRVLLNLPITVRTEAGSVGPAFNEDTQTLVLNAHGALIGLAGHVEPGQTVHLTSRSSQVEEACRVVYVGPISAGKAQVAVEFIKPSPDFWHIAFPPDDWIVPDQEPAANKGAGGSVQTALPIKK